MQNAIYFCISAYARKQEYKILPPEIAINIVYKIEEFGINTIRVLEHPSWIRDNESDIVIDKVFEKICQNIKKLSDIGISPIPDSFTFISYFVIFYQQLVCIIPRHI